MRNHFTGVAVTTHLGKGDFEGHTCVYGTTAGRPEGWFADFRMTAANGDILLAAWSAHRPRSLKRGAAR